MARRLEGTLRFRHDEAEATIEPSWPSCWTWLEELLLEPALSGVDLARPPAPSWPAAGDGQPNAGTTRGAPDAAKQLVLPSSH
jgi:hypothetical protein